MIITPDINQIKQATNILTNNHVLIKIINNKILIINNPSNVDIYKVLIKEFIRIK